jgi:formamidopyrimidine-DNA glycosylase
MPELPEVETVRLRLSWHCVGRKIVSNCISSAQFRSPLPMDLDLCDRTLRGVDRHGKLLLLGFDDGSHLLIHLGMTGCFLFGSSRDRQPSTHDHLSLEFGDGTYASFNDRRRFGVITYYSSADSEAFSARLDTLGPDALSSSFDAEYLRSRLHTRNAPIKALLMDQQLVAGIGNIYSCESLFRARISPDRPGRSLSLSEADELIVAIKSTLWRSIALGGATLDDYRGRIGEMGTFDQEFTVFGRGGQPCPGCTCRAGIVQTRCAGRVTYHCPERQH